MIFAGDLLSRRTRVLRFRGGDCISCVSRTSGSAITAVVAGDTADATVTLGSMLSSIGSSFGWTVGSGVPGAASGSTSATILGSALGSSLALGAAFFLGRPRLFGAAFGADAGALDDDDASAAGVPCLGAGVAVDLLVLR